MFKYFEWLINFKHSDSGDLVAFAEIDREEKSVYRFKVKVN